MDEKHVEMGDWIRRHHGLDLDPATATKLDKVATAVQRALEQVADPQVFDTEPALMTRVSIELAPDYARDPTPQEVMPHTAESEKPHA